MMRIFDRNPREETEAYLEFVKPEPEHRMSSEESEAYTGVEFTLIYPDGTREVLHPTRVTPVFEDGHIAGYEIAAEVR